MQEQKLTQMVECGFMFVTEEERKAYLEQFNKEFDKQFDKKEDRECKK